MKVKLLVGAVVLGIVTASADIFPENTIYQVCFTPGQDCTGVIVNAIKQAKNSIDALISGEKRGVSVQVILDKSNLSGNNSAIPALQQYNIPIWIDYKVRIAHNKVIIIDQSTVIIGSFNYTSSAQTRNAENMKNNWLIRKGIR